MAGSVSAADIDHDGFNFSNVFQEEIPPSEKTSANSFPDHSFSFYRFP